MELARIEKERYKKIQEYWDKLDAAVIGLGVPRSGNFISEVSQKYKDILVNSNTVGDILSQFFYEDGSVFDLKADYEQVSLPIEKLKTIEKVICLAGGLSKVDGIIAAARNGFINILVTDSVTASCILEKI